MQKTNGGFRLCKVFDVEIRIDWSLVIIFFLLAFNLGAGVLPAWHPGWLPAFTWLLAVVAAILFFASVLAHELSHALVARAFGIPVDRITLFVFGGVANIRHEPKTPGAELLIAVVGPISSIAIGALALVVGAGVTTGLSDVAANRVSVDVLARSAGPVATLLLWLGPINLLLGLFNLVPGFPLDGGRVLRAILWATTKDLRKATRWAATSGQVFAGLLVATGFAMLFGVYVPILGGGPGQGMWLALLGWFLHKAAAASYEGLIARQTLEDLPVSRVMRTDIQSVRPDLPLRELVDRYILATDQHAFPVVEGDQLVGLVCLQDVRRVPPDTWPTTTVRQVMTPDSDLYVVRPNEGTADALQKLADKDVDQVPVVEEGHLRGLLRRRDVMRWVEFQMNRAPA